MVNVLIFKACIEAKVTLAYITCKFDLDICMFVDQSGLFWNFVGFAQCGG